MPTDIRERVARLEPVKGAFTLTVMGHLAFVLLVWWWVEYKRFGTAKPVAPQDVPWVATTDVAAVTGTLSVAPAASIAKAEEVKGKPKSMPEERSLAESSPAKSVTQPVGSTVRQSPALPTNEKVSAAQPAPTTTPNPVEPKPVEEKKVYRAIPVDPVTLKPILPSQTSTAPQPPSPAAQVPSTGTTTSTSTTPQVSTSDASEFIKISRVDPGHTDIQTLDSVDDAIRKSMHEAWHPPQRGAMRDGGQSMQVIVSISREGKVLSFRPVTTDVDESLRSSVLEAVNSLATIGKVLPPSFSGDRYSVQIQFYVE